MDWNEIGPLLLGGAGSVTALTAGMVAATVQHRATVRHRRRDAERARQLEELDHPLPLRQPQEDAAKYVHQLPEPRRRPEPGTPLLVRMLWPLLLVLAGHRSGRISPLGRWLNPAPASIQPALLPPPAWGQPWDDHLKDWQAQLWAAARPEDRHAQGGDCTCVWLEADTIRAWSGEAFTQYFLSIPDPACPRAARAQWFDQMARKSTPKLTQ